MSGSAFAQDGAAQPGEPNRIVPKMEMINPPSAPTPPAPLEPFKGEWTDAEFGTVASMLIGTWKSTGPVASGSGEAFEITMSAAPVRVEGLPNTMYCEVARVDNFKAPFRQTILAISRVKGKIRIQTYEFRTSGGINRAFNNVWAANETFGGVTAADLVATLALDIPGSSGGMMTATTPHPYPTATGGAVEMTSELVLGGNMIKTADRGFGADGAQVWGPAAGQSYEFARWEAPIKVSRLTGGLTSFEYGGTVGEPAKAGEQISATYSGYLRNGTVFDSSFTRGTPFNYIQGRPLIEGWNIAMEQVTKGTSRRIIIPPAMGYGARGRPNIPANSWLIFDVDIVDVGPAPAPPAAPQPVPAQPVPSNTVPVPPK
jgi:hypothetical protein